MYFDRFPKIIYEFPFTNGSVLRQVTDITVNLRPLRNVLENVVYYEDYDIVDGDTPEIIAERVYKNPELHWVIMLINEKYDYLNDFPIPGIKLDEYIKTKYNMPGNMPNDVHILYGRPHYVSPKGYVVDGDTPFATPITNKDYEITLNDKKRRIRLVSPSLISVFVRDLEEAIPK